MKKYWMVVLLGGLGVLWGATEAMAQKTGKIEKLLAYLVDNDTEKFQKNREKLDEETLKNFPDEMGLVDALNDLWYVKKPEAATRYFAFYEQAMKKSLPAICTKEKIDVEKLRTRADGAILSYLSALPGKLAYSKQLIDAITAAGYRMPQDQLNIIYNTREEALLADIAHLPQSAQCEVYLKEFPKGRFLHPVMGYYNEALFQALRKSVAPETFKQYFDNPAVSAFFEQPENRKYMPEARALYDDFLFQLIQRSQDLAVMKINIDNYYSSQYLRPGDRKHIAGLEYKTDSVDYELLKTKLTGADQLHLVKDYLQTHRYKEFRDKAQALRTAFEEQVIWTAPAFMRSYSRGLLLKSNEVQKDRNTSTTYSYSDKGQLGNSVTTVSEKGQESVWQNNCFFDVHGHCQLEIQIDQRTKKERYRRSMQVTPAGEILSDSTIHADGRLELRTYDKAGRLTELQEQVKGKTMLTVTHTYDDSGRILRSNYTYGMPDTPQATHILSQTESYEYDGYGYLTRKIVERVMANNDKVKAALTCLYDEYGNAIDSHSYYEYDHTGRWIRKISADDPAWVEYVQCIYK